jgi:hypothetical protein
LLPLTDGHRSDPTERDASGGEMTETVQVEAARIPDRDRLMALLADSGLEPRALDEVGIEVPCDDAKAACDDVLAHVEDVIMDIGAPFVPIKHDGVIYIRPPLS